jgi:glutathione S-transferase
MPQEVILFGWRYSVYTRVAMMALVAKGVEFSLNEIDPFSATGQGALAGLHPFGRVPVLRQGAFTIYETAAITRYVDAGFPGPALVPPGAAAQARMTQVVSLIDGYAYWPLIRQVFAQRVFALFEGAAPDEAGIAKGLQAARPVLAALEAVADEALVLSPVALRGGVLTLADCHLAPVIDYFTRAPEGAAALGACPALSEWWAEARGLAALAACDPGPIPAQPPESPR